MNPAGHAIPCIAPGGFFLEIFVSVYSIKKHT
jgi:hypothetical protein